MKGEMTKETKEAFLKVVSLIQKRYERSRQKRKIFNRLYQNLKSEKMEPRKKVKCLVEGCTAEKFENRHQFAGHFKKHRNEWQKLGILQQELQKYKKKQDEEV